MNKKSLDAPVDLPRPVNLKERLPQLYFLICAGVLLPLAALLIELGTKICADGLFDPIPTLWHVLVVASVPLANAQIIWSLYEKRFERIAFLGWISALAGGASLLYTLVFIPVAPIAVLAIVVFFVGLLPLSPMFALFVTIRLRKYLRQELGSASFALSWRGLAIGFLAAAMIVGLSELRFVATRFGMEMAMSENVARQNEGINFLRSYGDAEYILRHSKTHRANFYISDFVIGLFRRSEIASSEEIYYRMTGRDALTNDIPSPLSFDNSSDAFWRNQDISLASSQIDASIDNDASLGYAEWTFTLKNKNQYRPMEGFAQIQLPPDAVVSRLTLWINGEEREAAYAAKGQVSNAYEQVTAQKRDPVLVTAAGRDRVNLKCFPIPAAGGEMKMKIGVTFPLVLESERSGLIRLPYFRDKNFQIFEAVKHSVWIESKRQLETENKIFRVENTGSLFAVRAELSDGELSDSLSAIRAVRSDEYKTVWAQDAEEKFITQEITTRAIAKPEKYIFVVDTSYAMAGEKEKIVSALKKLPAEPDAALILTNGNALNGEIAYPNYFSGKTAEIADRVFQAEFGGGTDNLPALTKAWDLANEKPNSVVIWIHAPQPYQFSTSDALAQRLARRPNQTTLYSLSTFNGFDKVEKQLDSLSYLQPVPRFGNIETDLLRLISQLNQSKKGFAYQRLITEKFDTFPLSKETSKHLVRLWANDEVNRLLTSPANDQAAVELAVKNRIVTPVSGAVVLETQAQYDQFGLKPVDKNSVPTIPEPEFYFLLAAVLGVLIWLFATRKLF